MSFWDGTRWVDERPITPPPPRQPRRRFRDIVATIPIVLLLPALLGPFLSAGAATAQMSVSGTIVPGGSITVVGSNFPARDWIQLMWDGSPDGFPTQRVNSRSEFDADVAIPGGATLGEHVISAIAASKRGGPNIASDVTLASVTVTVGGPTTAPTPTPPTAATPVPTPTPAPTATPTPTATPVSCPSGQYRAEYFANKTLAGTPARVACETAIDYRYGTSGPAGVPADSFSVRWTSSPTFGAGTYVFSGTSDDGSRLYVDGLLAIDAWVDQGATTGTATRSLTAGAHAIRYEYYENTGDAEALLSWVSSGTSAPTPTPTPGTTPAPTPTPTPGATPTPVPTPSPTPGASCGTSIQSRVNAAAAGSTVTIPACIYREKVSITKSLTLVAQPGAEIRGSDVWTTWTQSGSTWVSSNTAPALYNPGGSCTPGTSRCLWNEQAFMDGTALLQVSSSTTPGYGEFKVDGARRIVIGQNPTGRTVEVSTRENWIWVGASDVVIDGFRMKHASTWVQGGGINIGGYHVGAVNRVTVKNSVISDAHGRNIAIEGGVGHRIVNNDISRAGNIGVGGSGGSDWTIQGNYIHHNDTEDFDVGIESGGAKILFVDGLLVDNNEVAYNTRGIWTDTGVRNSTFSNNRLHHNGNNGLFLESSHYLTVTGNEAWENGWGPNGASWAWGGGITLASSDHANVYNNVVAWNADGITVISQSRTDDDPHVENNIHDNTIAMAPKSSDNSAFATAWVMDWSGILYNASSNNRGSNNKYWYPFAENSQARYAWSGSKTRLADYEVTPAEASGTYLTTAQKDSVLVAAGIPTNAVPR